MEERAADRGPELRAERGDETAASSAAYAAVALTALREGVVLQLASGEIVACNPAAERILGLTRDQMMGRTSVDPRWRAIHEDGSPFPGETHPGMVALRTGEPVREVVMGVPTPDGALRWISINAEPVPGPGGRPSGVVTTFTDVTERKASKDGLEELVRQRTEDLVRANQRLEESQATLAAAVRAMPDVVIVADASGKLLHTNEAFASFLRSLGEDAEPRYPEDFLALLEICEADGARTVRDTLAVRRALRGETGRDVEYLLRDRRTGQRWTWSTGFAPVRDARGSVTGAVVIARDVTAEREAEEKLRRQAQYLTLAQEVAKAGTWHWDIRGGRLDWPPEMFRLFGLDPETDEASFETWERVLHPDDRENARRELREALERHQPLRNASRFVRPDGEVVWIEVLARADYSESGEPLRMVGLCLDVTERREAEERVRQSDERLRLATEGAAVGVWYRDLVAGRVEWSPRCREQMGLPSGELPGRESFLDLVHPEDRERMRGQVAAAIERGGSYETEFRIVRADGEVRWIRALGRAYASPGDPTRAIGGITLDVTERIRRAEELERANAALRESEARLAAAIDAIPDSFFVVDAGGRMIFLNDEVARTAGLARKEDLPPHPERYNVDYDFFDLDGTPVPVEGRPIPRALSGETGRDVELRVVNRANRKSWIGSFAFGPVRERDGAISGAVVVSRDVTGQKRRERELWASRARLSLFVEHAPVALAMLDRELHVVAVSRRGRQEYGTPDREPIGRAFYEVFPEIPEAWKAVHRRGLAGETLRSDGEPFVRADGRVQWVRWEVRPWTEHDGSVGGLMVFSEDITTAKLAEEALRDSEERFRKAFQDNAVGMSMVGPDQRFLDVNPAICRFLGYDREELLGRSLWEVTHPDDLATDVDTFQALIRGDLPVHRTEKRYVRKDGRVVWGSLAVTRIRAGDRGVVHTLASVEDVDERRRIRDRLQAANAELVRLGRIKDEFLRMMSAELRTPLTSILGIADALRGDFYGPLREEQAGPLRILREAGERLLTMVEDLLELSRVEGAPGEGKASACRVAAVGRACLAKVRPAAVAKRQQVSFAARPPDLVVTTDGRRLEKVLGLLLDNAVRFTPEGGQVGLNVALDEEARSARFTVWDTGVGIAPEATDRLFEPFVRLDADEGHVRGGAGIGLALAKRLTGLLGGTIAVESEPGQGSRFTVSVPLDAGTGLHGEPAGA